MKKDGLIEVVGWAVFGKKRPRSRSHSRSSSIGNRRVGRGRIERGKSEEREQGKRVVTMIEGKQNVVLMVEEGGEKEERGRREKTVVMDVDLAVSGEKG